MDIRDWCRILIHILILGGIVFLVEEMMDQVKDGVRK